MPPETNASTIKTKSGKLSIFARHSSEGDARHNAAPVQNVAESLPKRSDTPVLPSSTLPREEVAKRAQVPVAQVFRHAAPAQELSAALSQQPLPPSPKRLPPQSPQKPSVQQSSAPGRRLAPGSPRVSHALVASRQPLFAGSQLGDDFMASGLTSGLTTPHAEFQEPPQQPVADEANPIPADSQAEGLVRDKAYRSKHDDSFKPPLMSNNGLFMARPIADYEIPGYMVDGFQSGVAKHHSRYRTENDRAQSPIRRAVKIPIREEPRKARPATEDMRKERARSPSVDYPDIRRHHAHDPSENERRRAQDIEDRIGSHKARADVLYEAPKVSRRNTLSRKRPSGSPVRAPTKPLSPASSRKHGRASPDYDDAVLGTKTFSELQGEPFDLDPAKTVILNGDGAPGDNLAKRLERVQNQPEEDQIAYFGTMPLDQWEASGDWFVDQFSSLMTRFKDARREKRRLVQGFEAEAARREEAVRLRTDAIDDKLVKMRQDGQRVVGSRML